jgi:hypothetical protein
MNNATTTGVLPTVPLASGDGFGFGGDGIWALLIFAMIFNNGWGFGNNGMNNLATTDYVSSEFTKSAINDLETNMNNGFARTNDNLCDVRQAVYNTGAGISNQVLENRYAGQLSACQTQRDILTQTNELNTNLLTTALQSQAKMDECCCQIKTAIREDGEATRALITSNTIQDLREQLNDAKNTITANGIGSTIINSVRPYPVPAYAVSSPYVGLNGFYGSNWYGNTIV